jgi:probable phosphoglycerate mutase
MANAIWIIRHGATEWSEAMRHTGRTDLPLTEAGATLAAALEPVLAQHEFACAISSPLHRARETARLAGFDDPVLEPDLEEWDYGEFEGLTTEHIRAQGREWADWTVFRGPIPGGETLEQVAVRARRAYERVEAVDGDVVVFAHAHILRIFATVACDLEPEDAARLALDPATISVLGLDRGERIVRRWNHPPT